MDPRTPGVDPDLTVAASFLTLLDEEAEGFSFQTFDDAKKGRQLARILYGPLDRHARELARLGLRKTMQREHPDKGGSAERFRAAKAELDALREQAAA